MRLDRPASLVAPDLLGCLLRVDDVRVRITEVEAYEGEADPASHAWRGVTPRTRVMFGPAGVLYVYFSYGMHSAVNVVCGEDGTASAVLLRAGEVVGGLDTVRLRRGPTAPGAGLARGPGNLGAALGLTWLDSGLALDGVRAELVAGEPVPHVSTGPRVGVSRAADVPWRFWITGDPTVSAYKRSPRAERPDPEVGRARLS